MESQQVDGGSEPKRLKTDESSIPKESTGNGEAVPVSEAAKRQIMIETELNGMIQEMMASEDFEEEDEMEPESYAAIMKAAKEICYTRKIYDVSADKIVFFPSITKTIVNMDLFEKAEEYYYDEGDEFPMEYSMGLRNVAFEKLEAEGDDDEEEMDDDMMERLSMAVQLTEDDKDELQEAIAAAEAADEEEADQQDTDEKEDFVMDPVTAAADQKEEDQDTDKKEDYITNPISDASDQEETDQGVGEKEDSATEPVNEVTDQEDVDQETDEKGVSAADPIGPQVESSSASPNENTASDTVSKGEAVPVSEAAKRQNMIDTELNGMIKEMMDSEDFEEEDEMEPESYEAIMKAAKEICYTRKIYDVSADKIVFFPSITKTIVNMDLFEKAEEYYYDEGDEFPMEYSMGLRNVAFEKLEAEGDGDDDEEEMDDDMMERLSMAVQLTEDDKDELQEAIAAAEAADREEAESAMDPVNEVTDREEDDQNTDDKKAAAIDPVTEAPGQEGADQEIDDKKQDPVVDSVTKAADQEEADQQDTDEKEDSAVDPVTEAADQAKADQQDTEEKKDSAMDSVTKAKDQEEADQQETDEKEDSAVDPISPQQLEASFESSLASSSDVGGDEPTLTHDERSAEVVTIGKSNLAPDESGTPETVPSEEPATKTKAGIFTKGLETAKGLFNEHTEMAAVACLAIFAAAAISATRR
ncbi:unnamed protein product [Cylindrotheca closterium]|uniref:Uncharacterized protein n=1 Tax=Cylindrotheca closterium TaxID=2856 RepID=A0AAD2G915_9STRA|nr:unnamed protein product [Cylindrotheca closterium]